MRKKERAAIVIERLKKEYPGADCTLDYNEAWKLLVSVRLAAQCTDERVNIIVKDLFAKYPGINELAQAEPEEIEEIVLAHPLVHGMHDLIVHDYGPGRLILSLHAEVPAHGDLLIIHDEIDNIEHELQDKLNCSATIHIDPIVTDNKEVNEMRSQIEEITRNLDRRLSIHDFRIVEGPTHTNLIFDIAVPFECKLTNVEITNLLKERIRNMDDGNYCAVIQIDRVYS